jgi:hypothetical protein
MIMRARADPVKDHPRQHTLFGRVEDGQLSEQKTESYDADDGGDSGQDTLHYRSSSYRTKATDRPFARHRA